jgi:phasin family protein
MQVQELVSATQKSSVEMFADLSSAFADGMDKICHLNMEAARSMLSASHDFSQQVLSSKSPSDWLTLQDTFVHPATDQVQNYNRQLLDIAATAQATYVRCTQAQVEECSERTRTLLQDFAKNAPQGSGPVVTALESAISAANQLYGSLQQTSQQAIEVARSNMEMAASAASKAAKRDAEPTERTTKS